MTYATQVDIENEFKRISFNDTNDVVSSTALAGFLDQTDAFIDMYLEDRYNLPIVSSGALLVLKKIAVDIVVCRVRGIVDLTKSNPFASENVKQDSTSTKGCCDNNATLNMIKNGRMKLPGEELKDPTGGLSSFHAENITIEPVFKKGVTQW